LLIVCLVTSVLCFVLQRSEGAIDAQVYVILAISALFTLFATGMTAASIRLNMLNMTNVDLLQRQRVIQLAVYVPLDTPSNQNFLTVTYPLPPPQGEESVLRPQPLTQRKFAILRMEPGENPWHLGYLENWKAVMGPRPIDWLLPTRPLPRTQRDDMSSMYPMGPAFERLKQRYEIGSG
jgi:palmitoyltransferase